MYSVAIGDAGRRIREARIAYRGVGMTITSLAKLLGVSHARLSNWERGLHDPAQPYLLKAAQILEVPLQRLVLGENYPFLVDIEELKRDKMVKVPLYHANSKGEIPYGGASMKSVEVESTLADSGAFGIQVSDLDNAARIMSGDQLICIPCENPIVGKIYAFAHKSKTTSGSDGKECPIVIIRQFIFESGRTWLRAKSSEVADVPSDDWKAVGLVIKKIKFFAADWKETEENPHGIPWDRP